MFPQDKSLALLPEVQQQQVKTGKLPELIPPDNEVDAPEISDIPKRQEPILTSLLVPSVNSSLGFRVENAIPSLRPSFNATPSKVVGSVNPQFNFRKYASTFSSQASLFDNAERVPKSLNGIAKNFKFDDIMSPASHNVSSVIATPLKEFNRSSSRNPRNSHLHDEQLSRVSPEKGKNKFTNQFQNTSPYSRRVAADPIISPSRSHGLLKDSAQDSYLNASGKNVPSDKPDKNWAGAPSGDLMDISSR